MNRVFKPNDRLDASNSRLVGVSIDKKGNVRKIRARVYPQVQAPEIVTSKELLNRLSDHFENAGL